MIVGVEGTAWSYLHLASDSDPGLVSRELAADLHVGIGADRDTAARAGLNVGIPVEVDPVPELDEASVFVLEDHHPVSNEHVSTELKMGMNDASAGIDVASWIQQRQRLPGVERRLPPGGQLGSETSNPG